MVILCHVGPWSKLFFEDILKNIKKCKKYSLISTHSCSDDTDLNYKYLYFLNKYKKTILKASIEDLDIIKRCRLLRCLDEEIALKHLVSMRKAVNEVLDDVQPNIFITETIDSYVMDIIHRESLKRNIKCIGLVNSFINGYYRISMKGEANNLRFVEKNEVEIVQSRLLNNDYIPLFVAKDKTYTSFKIIKKWFRNILKIFYFALKLKFTKNKFNYHYWASLIVAKQWFHIIPKINLGNKNWRGELDNKSIKIYVPLQMIPEATVDYWCDDTDYIDYENVLLSFISKNKSIQFIVKEHPNVIGYRNAKFYKKLEKNDNVIICPYQENSNICIEYSDAVLVWTGSVGFETILRDKPLLTFSETYYLFNKRSYLKLNNEKSCDIIKNYIENHIPLSLNEKQDNLLHILSGCFKGHLIFDGTYTEKNDKKITKNIAVDLEKYIINV